MSSNSEGGASNVIEDLGVRFCSVMHELFFKEKQFSSVNIIFRPKAKLPKTWSYRLYLLEQETSF